MLTSLYITITGCRKADGYLRDRRHGAMLSLAGATDNKRGVERTGRDLLLDFDDTWPERGARRVCATPEQVRQIIVFARSLPNETMLLCHCGRGKSRSTAAALICWVARGASEATACRQLFAQAPGSNPNGWLLRLADEQLGTHLVTACRAYRIKGDG